MITGKDRRLLGLNVLRRARRQTRAARQKLRQTFAIAEKHRTVSGEWVWSKNAPWERKRCSERRV